MPLVKSLLCAFLLCLAFADTPQQQPPELSKKCYEFLKANAESGAFRCEVHALFTEGEQIKLGLLGLSEYRNAEGETAMAINLPPNKYGVFYEIIQELIKDFDHVVPKRLDTIDSYRFHMLYNNKGVELVYYSAVIDDSIKAIAAVIAIGYKVNFDSPNKDEVIRKFTKNETNIILTAQKALFPAYTTIPMTNSNNEDLSALWLNKDLDYLDKLFVIAAKVASRSPFVGIPFLTIIILYAGLRYAAKKNPDKTRWVIEKMIIRSNVPASFTHTNWEQNLKNMNPSEVALIKQKILSQTESSKPKEESWTLT